MEDRLTLELYLETTDLPIERYAAERVPAVLALPAVERATWWRNLRRDRRDLPRSSLPDFDHLGVFELREGFRAPATPPGVTGYHFRRYPRPAQGILTGRPTIGLLLVLVSPDDPARAQALRDWADFVHIRRIAEASVPGYGMITPYENVTGGNPRFLHLYEMDSDDPEGAFRSMTPLVMRRIGDRDSEGFNGWASGPGLKIEYVNTFRRIGVTASDNAIRRRRGPLSTASFRPARSSSSQEGDQMTSLRGKVAVVSGASSGVGKATVQALVEEGVRVTAVARGGDGLRALRAEAGAGVETVQADASDPAVADRLIRELKPDLVVLAAGIQPAMGPLAEQTWESFSETWNTDLKAAFHFMRAAVTTPLREGSAVIVVSSGAAINGSHLSGGYAGAKRMQWLLAGYAQTHANAKKLGIRFLAVLPIQLIEGTKISVLASSSYAAWQGISPREYMSRFEVPLDAQKVAAAIVGGLRGDVVAGVTAIAVSGKGVEPLG